jgi:DNA repair protein RadA/Sms
MLANKAKAVDHVGEVLYVSGEESALQVKMRAERLGDISDDLFVVSETNIDHIIQMIEHLPENSNMKQVKNGHKHFGAVVIDSIQTVFAEDIPSAAGTVNQVKECTLRLLRLSKASIRYDLTLETYSDDLFYITF